MLRAFGAGADVAEELLLRAVFDDLAGVHEDHTVGHFARKPHFVGYAHHGHAFVGQLHHHVEHFVDHLRVERRGRFVEQHDDRVHGQGAGNRHPLLLAAGKLARVLVRVCRKADALKQLQALFGGFFLAAAKHLDLRDGQVFGDGQVREQFEVLEHHAHARAQLRQVGLRVGDRRAVHHHVAFLERFQCVDALDQGGFTRAGRPAHHDHFAFFNLGAAIGQHLEVAIPLVDVLDRDHTANLFCRRLTSSEAEKLMMK